MSRMSHAPRQCLAALACSLLALHHLRMGELRSNGWRLRIGGAVSLLIASVALLAAEAVAAAGSQCPLPGQYAMVRIEFYFGRDVRGRGPVTESEWSRFVADTVATQFPDGFTVEDGNGEWLDPATHRIVRERTKILIVAATPSRDLSNKVEAVAGTYRKRFRQESVGIVSTSACARF